MRRFSFRLQPVLKLREKREEEALTALARAQSEFYRQLEEMERISSLMEESLEAAPRGTLSPEELFHLAVWRQHLDSARETREEEVARARERLAACRERAEAARREKLVLERLREKQLRAHLREEARAAQKELDEKGIQAVWRRKGGFPG
ncbi:flagellar export protein FliJ [Desulfovirgula thermocuniculi]|uniref:flagellar export protein FliJ n=1 Tax=Desulfovirgula thermocuniculi TaxID=348842 RepID=UPI00146FC0BD|nr:flagellar export protein FliJ [Desulfovirgula thermocuniculi]